jgi:hypothetical protein
MNDYDTYNTMRLRDAIGIGSEGFELSDADYLELLQFDPCDYEGFRHSCDQIGAKYPTRARFDALCEALEAED